MLVALVLLGGFFQAGTPPAEQSSQAAAQPEQVLAEQARTDAAGARGEAVLALMEEGGAGAKSTLTYLALNDPDANDSDPRVREAATEVLEELGTDQP